MTGTPVKLTDDAGRVRFEGLQQGGGGGSQPAYAWEKVATIGYADTPADGTILDLVTLPSGTWLADVYVEVAENDEWDSQGSGPRFSACGWDLAGAGAGPFYLHSQMPFNTGSWANLQAFNTSQTISGNANDAGGYSLAEVGRFLGTTISTSPNAAAPPVYISSYLPGRLLSLVDQLDPPLPLQLLFSADAPVTYHTGSADIWLLKADPA